MKELKSTKNKQKKANLYRTLKIPAERFYKIIETGDIRWVQIVTDDEFVKMPEGEMYDAFQAISELFDKCSETRLFMSNNMEVLTDMQKGSKILAMVLAYYYFEFGQEQKAVNLLERFDINITPDDFGLNRLVNMIETQQTISNIKMLSKKTDDKDKSSFMDVIVFLDEVLGGEIDAEKITLEKYISKTKRAKEKLKSLSKKNKYGR